MPLPAADHELTDDEIRESFGLLLRAGVAALRADPWMVVDLVENIPSVSERLRQQQAQEPRERPVPRPSDEYLREAFEAGLSSGDVAKAVGTYPGRVLSWWNDIGLSASDRPKPRSKRKDPGRSALREYREKVVREDHAAGVPAVETAAKLEISDASVYAMRRRLGSTSERKRRVQRWDAVASREQFAALFDAGLLQREAAQRLGCSEDVVRRAWRAQGLNASERNRDAT